MKKWITKIFKILSKTFRTFLFWLIWGTGGGLGLFIVIGFTRYGFIYALIVAFLFLPFHISDYRGFIQERNWIAIISRSLCLYFIGAYVGGFVATVGGLMKISVDIFDMYIMLICLLTSYFCLFFGLILQTFFKESRLYKYLLDIFDGLHITGVFWR